VAITVLKTSACCAPSTTVSWPSTTMASRPFGARWAEPPHRRQAMAEHQLEASRP
jgi:hypothetical protein